MEIAKYNLICYLEIANSSTSILDYQLLMSAKLFT